MHNEKETKENLLKSAKAEFLEKGYTAASLRTICKNAGVTTGALYFFFKDKEDLFASLVEEPLEHLLKVMKEHYATEIDTFSEIIQLEPPKDFSKSDDFLSSMEAIKLLYSHYDEMVLLIAKSQGSRFEHCLDTFVELTEKHYEKVSAMISEKTNTPYLDEHVIHWISHVQIEAFSYLLSHVKSPEQAIKLFPQIIKYLTGGWYNLFN